MVLKIFSRFLAFYSLYNIFWLSEVLTYTIVEFFNIFFYCYCFLCLMWEICSYFKLLYFLLRVLKFHLSHLSSIVYVEWDKIGIHFHFYPLWIIVSVLSIEWTYQFPMYDGLWVAPWFCLLLYLTALITTALW